MRVRFFNTYEPVTTFYRDLLPFVAARGIETEVLVSAAEYRSGRGHLDQALAMPNVRITYVSAGGATPTGRLQKIWIMLTYIWGAALWTLVGPFVDLNFFLTQPPLFSVWGVILKKLRRQRYACLVMDIYPDVAIQDGLLKAGTVVARILSALSRFALREADAVVVIGRCMAERIEAMSVPRSRICVIPNWANERNIFPVECVDNSLRRELGLENDFVVLYSGNMGVSHYFNDILEVARRCRDVARLKFVFAGDGSRRKEIEQFAAKHILQNVVILPFQPLERLAESLSMGDVHFVSLRSGFEGLVVPSKAYGTLAVGRPMIYQGSPAGEIARMVIEEQIGAVVSLGDVDQLEKTILAYYWEPALAARQGEKAFDLVQGRYSSKQALEAYASFFLNPTFRRDKT